MLRNLLPRTNENENAWAFIHPSALCLRQYPYLNSLNAVMTSCHDLTRWHMSPYITSGRVLTDMQTDGTYFRLWTTDARENNWIVNALFHVSSCIENHVAKLSSFISSSYWVLKALKTY